MRASVFFVKKSGPFPPQNEIKINAGLIFYFTFYLFGGAYAPNAPPSLRAAVLRFTVPLA